MGRRRDSAPAAAGFLLLDKPAGVTTHDVVADVRRALGTRRVGHAGTLDPFATGLVVVLVGAGTRLMQWVVGHDKRYRAGIRLGAMSSTDDRDGEVVAHDVAMPGEDTVRAALAELARTGTQVPPQVSALHVDGERAWRRVLRGEQLDLPARPVRIEALDLLAYDRTRGTVDVEVVCSSGTYVRAIARDLGVLLQTGGYCETLRRECIGSLALDGAVSPDDVGPQHVRPLVELVAALPQLVLDADATHQFVRGQRLAFEQLPGAADLVVVDGGAIAVLDGDGALVGIAVTRPGRFGGVSLQPRTVFGPAAAAVQGGAPA